MLENAVMLYAMTTFLKYKLKKKKRQQGCLECSVNLA